MPLQRLPNETVVRNDGVLITRRPRNASWSLDDTQRPTPTSRLAIMVITNRRVVLLPATPGARLFDAMYPLWGWLYNIFSRNTLPRLQTEPASIELAHILRFGPWQLGTSGLPTLETATESWSFQLLESVRGAKHASPEAMQQHLDALEAVWRQH